MANDASKDMPGIKENELVALGPCAVCNKPLLEGGVTFYRVRIERAMLDQRAIQERVGLSIMMGNDALARVFSPNRDLATIFDGPHQRAIHEDCAHTINSLLLLCEAKP